MICSESSVEKFFEIGAVDIPYFLRIFFSIWLFIQKHSRTSELQGKWENVSLTPKYHFQPLHRHLEISLAIISDSSPLHIASIWSGTGNL